jgi:hypothetical protein
VEIASTTLVAQYLTAIMKIMTKSKTMETQSFVAVAQITKSKSVQTAVTPSPALKMNLMNVTNLITVTASYISTIQSIASARTFKIQLRATLANMTSIAPKTKATAVFT